MQRSFVFSVCALVTGSLSAPAAIAQTPELENFAHLPAQPVTFAQAVETPTQAFFVKPKYGINFTTGPGSGYNSSFGSIYGWLPFAQNGTSQLFYTEAKANLNSDNGNWGGNLAVGYRNFAAKTILGGYFGYDVQGLEGWTAHQLGAGLEAMNPKWEARLNGYLPVGDRRQIIDSSESTTTSGNPSTALAFRGNNLFITSETVTTTTIKNMLSEESLAGIDLETGTTFTRWKNGQLKGFIGSYLYGGDRTETFVGIRGRLQAKISNFDLGIGLESDGEFGTNLLFSIGANFGGSLTTSPESKENQLSNPLQRQSNIATKRYTDSQTSTTEIPGTEEIALNPATNQPLFFSHVNLGSAAGGAGTEENPYGAIASAISSVPTDGNGIIYVEGTGTQPGFQIPAQVKVLSSAPVQTLSVKTTTSAAQNLVLPRSGTGNAPTLTSDVTFSGSGEFNGFSINGAAIDASGGNGTVAIKNNFVTGAPDVGIAYLNGSDINLTIDNNTISNSTGDAIKLSINQANASANLTITNNKIDGTINDTADGIDIETGDENLTNAPVTSSIQVVANIAGNTIANTKNTGIELESYDDSTFISTVSGNTINDSNRGGIEFNARENSILNSNLTSNKINRAGGDGILFLHDSTKKITLEIIDNTIATTGVNGNGITITSETVSIPTIGPVTVTTNIGSGGFGIGVITLANGDLDLAITNNQISDTQDAKIGIAANPAFLYLDSITIGVLGGTAPGNVTPDIQATTVFLQGEFAGSSRVDADIFGNTLTGTGAGIDDLSALTGANAVNYDLSNYNNGSFTAIAGNNGILCLNLENNTANEVNGSAYQFIRNNSPQLTGVPPFTNVTPQLTIGNNTGNSGLQVTTDLATTSGTCN